MKKIIGDCDVVFSKINLRELKDAKHAILELLRKG